MLFNEHYARAYYAPNTHIDSLEIKGALKFKKNLIVAIEGYSGLLFVTIQRANNKD